MPTEHIIALLVAERDKLNRAIDALQGPIRRRPSAEESARFGRFFRSSKEETKAYRCAKERAGCAYEGFLGEEA
jgi:hypothetical protein